ncbi:MAG: cytochrome C [Betaproteobacteria bacterium]|nr:cytochrome C [Betaproteobacteria bacterium]
MRLSKLAICVIAGIVCIAGAPLARAADAPDNATCLGCHGNEGFSMPGPDGKPRELHVTADKFGKSVHGQLPCVMCHQDITAVPHQETHQKVDCGTCHSAQKTEYLASVHGQEAVGKGNPKAATCTSCHTAHEIASPKTDAVKLAITKTCGGCHAENLKSYADTYHGQINALGYSYTAKCFDCHGSHGIQRVKDPKSTVHPDNRLQTCQKCHANASPGFATFQPHGNAHDFNRYPQIWIASKFMIGLLAGTFAFFWLHAALWFYREYKERQERKNRPHVKTEQLLQGKEGKHYRRFSLTWRIAHLTFAVSLMILTLTGMTLFYAESAWAPIVVKAFGGPHVTGMVHRVCAVIFAFVFFAHLVYVALRLARDWRNFRIFGPNSLIPNWQDLWDIIAMFKWFLGFGPRPVFDRWTYWEKFDYWAPFWGVTIIGVSGFMLWFPNLTATLLPGWAFNVAAIAHGEEAFLAAVFLFTVHFFNNHFRPDKFPLDIVMFTGTVPLEDFKRDHTVEFNRLVASGKLDDYLVDAPSQPMTRGSKILGFTLIFIGLTLLTLVLIGFAGNVMRG